MAQQQQERPGADERPGQQQQQPQPPQQQGSGGSGTGSESLIRQLREWERLRSGYTGENRQAE